MTESREKNSSLPQQVVGIVCALHLEIAPLLHRLKSNQTQTGNGLKFHDCQLGHIRIVIVEGGAGYQRAKEATHAVIDAFAPKWVLSTGLSGSLVDDVELSHIILGNSFIRENGLDEIRQRFVSPPETDGSIHVGKLCTTDHIVHTCREKRELHLRTDAIAVDMESHAVASICRDRSVQFMAIRAISDDLSADLPKEILAIFGPNGTIRTGALVGTIFKRPSSIKDLWKIRETAVQAAEKLAQKTLELIPELLRATSE